MKTILIGLLCVPVVAAALSPAYEYTNLSFLIDSANFNGSDISGLNNHGDIFTSKGDGSGPDISYSIFDRNFNLVRTISQYKEGNVVSGYRVAFFNDNRDVTTSGLLIEKVSDKLVVYFHALNFKADGTVQNYGIYGNHDSGPFRINNQGQVIVVPSSPGELANNNPNTPIDPHPAIYTPGSGWKPITSPSGLGPASDIYALNDHGLVVGSSNDRPMVWDAVNGGRFIGSNFGGATAVNNAGFVAGVDSNRTFIFNSNTGELNYLDVSFAFTPKFINSSNVIVGHLLDGVVVYSEEFGLFALEDYIGTEPRYTVDGKYIDTGWRFQEARGFNDAGEILAQGRNDKLGVSGIFLLRPVPEPSTYALMALGLGLIAYLRRRPRNR